MNRPTMLTRCLLEELSEQFSLSAHHDVRTFDRRVKHEGYGFLAITLPRFCDSFEESLERGYIAQSDFPGFKRDKTGSFPLFLSGFLMYVFDVTGKIRQDVCADAVYAIRQITRVLKKPFVVCSEKRTLAAARRYVELDRSLSDYEDHIAKYDPLLTTISMLLWGRLFRGVVPETFRSCHSSGASADKVLPNQRWDIKAWPSSANQYFPMDLHCIPNFGCAGDLGNVEELSEGEHLPVKVVFVPKTMSTPRVIAMEPHYMMFMQQGVMSHLVREIENDDIAGRSVRFTDQFPNQDKARLASISKSHATLDMSDASDRVHLELVRKIFGTSDIWPYLLHSRSDHAYIPVLKQRIKLRKFASMGSATCFPVEAMVFYTLVMCAYHRAQGIRPTLATLRHYSDQVAVYGDDLIVPTHLRETVTDYLESFGLRVNARKSFSNSKFRESCGGDFYDGTDVSVVYLRRDLRAVSDLTEPGHIVSLAATSDQFYKKGLWKTCQLIRDWIESKAMYGKRVPRTRHEHAGLMFHSCIFDTNLLWHSDTQSLIPRVTRFEPRLRADAVETISGFLLRSLGRLAAGRESGTDAISLAKADFARSVNRGVFKVKHRWALGQRYAA